MGFWHVYMGIYGGGEAATDPSQAGWIARPADRLNVASVADRLAIFSPQQRVWIARSDNE